ncbi:MAG TPA: GntR family transcriptional regulator [Solirubrobacterales bacterium]|jgi:GntR family transcriptional regulator|nr:GntR family transcriptional regulator [Solirubrobacterales bacterium]
MAQRTVDRETTPFSTDPAADLPVGVQLSWRLRALIATGRLAAGERLPSFRRLAEWAGVNVNTVRTVYAGLEESGLVVSRQGQGTFVAGGIEAVPELEEIAAEALQRVREAGLDPSDFVVVATACASMAGDEEIATATHRELPDLAKESEAIEVRHELRRQIARLEVELAAYTRDLPGDMPTAGRFSKAHVAGVEELEQTRDTLIDQLSEAQRAAERRAKKVGEVRARREAQLEKEDGDVSAQSGGGPLSRAMSWWQAKS